MTTDISDITDAGSMVSAYNQRANVLVVDGSNLLMRAHFAMLHGPALTTSVEGVEVETGAVNTFLNLLSKYVRQERPTHLAVCWDGGGSFRKTLYPEYKAGRDRPDDRGFFDLASEALTRLGIYHLEISGIEADDLVAAYWRWHYDQPVRFVILSGDKDFLQLVDTIPITQYESLVLRPGAKPEVWDLAQVMEALGCLPSDLPNVMALSGDKVDGIPGIKGVAHKTAVTLLSKYDWSLRNLLASDEKKVQGQSENVALYRQLVDLRGETLGYEPPVVLGPVPEFNPVTKVDEGWEALVGWLGKYELNGIRFRLEKGSYW